MLCRQLNRCVVFLYEGAVPRPAAERMDARGRTLARDPLRAIARARNPRSALGPRRRVPLRPVRVGRALCRAVAGLDHPPSTPEGHSHGRARSRGDSVPLRLALLHRWPLRPLVTARRGRGRPRLSGGRSGRPPGPQRRNHRPESATCDAGHCRGRGWPRCSRRHRRHHLGPPGD